MTNHVGTNALHCCAPSCYAEAFSQATVSGGGQAVAQALSSAQAMVAQKVGLVSDSLVQLALSSAIGLRQCHLFTAARPLTYC